MSSSEASIAEYSQTDLSTLSNANDVTSTFLRLSWELDFDKQEISGHVEHDMKVLVSNTTHVHFDSSKIQLVGDVFVNGGKANCEVSEAHEVLGSKISIEIPTHLQAKDSIFTVKISYVISSEASAVQWLAPSATKGGVFPYVFTQCQAIHARSLLPCMDSPGVKTPYTATVVVPDWCTVLMSALEDTTESKDSIVVPDGKRAFRWTQPVPTPAYLIALAAGNLASRDVSGRVRIWAEPEVVESAEYEFAQTEDFLSAAEQITGCPYQWVRYDVLCLPPSFPYGGMENPCLTFATPTLLAGDRSLADVIAHEIAHSWTGNLVTNHTWAHFWLNEGWTMWLQRKIGCKVKNDDEDGKLSAQIGWKALSDDIARMGGSNAEFSALVWPLSNGQDPDDAFSSVPYEKGFNLLNQLEQLIGREHFESFARHYIDTYKFGTVTSGQFRDTFRAFCADLATPKETVVVTAAAATPAASSGGGGGGNSKNKKNKNKNKAKKEDAAPAAATPQTTVVIEEPRMSADVYAAVQALDWTQLLHGRGLPVAIPDFSNSLAVSADALAKKWITAAAQALVVQNASMGDIEGWSTQQTCLFLETLQVYVKEQDVVQEGLYSHDWLTAMDTAYGFTHRKNAEIQLRWQTLCLGSNAPWIVPHVVDFISSQGRMKYVRPLYRSLRASEVGRHIADKTFEEHKDSYHPIARKMLVVDLATVARLEAEQDALEAAETAAERETTEEAAQAVEIPTKVEPVHEAVDTATVHVNGEVAPEAAENTHTETDADADVDTAAAVAAAADVSCGESGKSSCYDNASIPTDATVIGSSRCGEFSTDQSVNEDHQYLHHHQADVDATDAAVLNQDLTFSASQDNMSVLTDPNDLCESGPATMTAAGGGEGGDADSTTMMLSPVTPAKGIAEVPYYSESDVTPDRAAEHEHEHEEVTVERLESVLEAARAVYEHEKDNINHTAQAQQQQVVEKEVTEPAPVVEKGILTTPVKVVAAVADEMSAARASPAADRTGLYSNNVVTDLAEEEESTATDSTPQPLTPVGGASDVPYSQLFGAAEDVSLKSDTVIGASPMRGVAAAAGVTPVKVNGSGTGVASAQSSTCKVPVTPHTPAEVLAACSAEKKAASPAAATKLPTVVEQPAPASVAAKKSDQKPVSPPSTGLGGISAMKRTNSAVRLEMLQKEKKKEEMKNAMIAASSPAVVAKNAQPALTDDQNQNQWLTIGAAAVAGVAVVGGALFWLASKRK